MKRILLLLLISFSLPAWADYGLEYRDLPIEFGVFQKLSDKDQSALEILSRDYNIDTTEVTDLRYLLRTPASISDDEFVHLVLRQYLAKKGISLLVANKLDGTGYENGSVAKVVKVEKKTFPQITLPVQIVSLSETQLHNEAIPPAYTENDTVFIFTHRLPRGINPELIQRHELGHIYWDRRKKITTKLNSTHQYFEFLVKEEIGPQLLDLRWNSGQDRKVIIALMINNINHGPSEDEHVIAWEWIACELAKNSDGLRSTNLQDFLNRLQKLPDGKLNQLLDLCITAYEKHYNENFLSKDGRLLIK